MQLAASSSVRTGQPVCVGGVKPVTEICDGKDNDCNGIPDDNVTGFGIPCGTSEGECTPGTLLCQAGTILCVGGTAPGNEYCDGLDTDCDTVLDHPACIFPATGREQRLDQIGSPTGASNSGQLHVAGNGSRVLAVWLDRRSGHAEIYANLSTNGGQSWGAATSSSPARVHTARLSRRLPSAAPPPPRCAPTWSMSTSTPSASRASGTFTSGGQPRAVLAVRGARRCWSSGPARARGTHCSSGWPSRLAPPARPDTVAVCWERIPTSGPVDPNVRCNISLDSGQSFPENDVQVNSVDNSVNDGALVPNIAIDSDYLYVTWQQFDYTNPSFQDKIRVARSSLVRAAQLRRGDAAEPQSGRNPRIATDGTGTVIVVWEDIRTALTTIRANRSTDQGGGLARRRRAIVRQRRGEWLLHQPLDRHAPGWADLRRLDRHQPRKG